VRPATCARQAEDRNVAPFRSALLVTLALLLSACGSAPPRSTPSESDLGTFVAREAAQLIGRPYRYGGDDLRGFDCSGLVFYAHDKRGIEVPRTADEQSRAATPVATDELVPGDLVFFRIRSRKVDHVGIYAGDGRFIHAPSTGQVVSMAYLDDPYYRRHMTGAGRFWRASARP
jgi:cell wall-associated NlpC family hydrolase